MQLFAVLCFAFFYLAGAFVARNNVFAGDTSDTSDASDTSDTSDKMIKSVSWLTFPPN